jgi:prepilin peptidase CpaA
LNLVAGAPQWLIIVLAILLVAAAAQDAALLKMSFRLGLSVPLGVVVIAVLSVPRLEIWQNLALFALFIAIGIPLFATGKLGGGDVKLLAAVGFWYDFQSALGLLLAVVIAGGILALVMVSLRMVRWSEKARERIIVLQPRKGIPYAIAIAAGALMTIVAQRGL